MLLQPPTTLVLLLALLAAAPVRAQARLTLGDAIARARTNNVDVRATASAGREAAARVAEVRGGFLPKVDAAASWQRGNQPVFVFGSLLAQGQFTAANFALDALNHPAAVDNMRTAVSVDQALFQPATTAALRSARFGYEVAARAERAVAQSLAVDVTDVYGRVLVSIASRQAAAAAFEAATADRERAVNRRDAGRATDADVLQLDVYLARVREAQIRAAAAERIARATLNQLMAEPLDQMFTLELAPAAAAGASRSLAALEAEAIANRPDVQMAVLQERQAEAGRDAARAAFLPQVSAQAGWEFNTGGFNTGASSWVVGAVARIPLFQGSDRARLAGASEQIQRRALEREKVENAVRLALRDALARLDDASAREEAGRDTAAQARESQRIVRDRYDGGLADVVALLRAAEAVEEADARRTAAQVDLVLANAMLDRALGRQQP